MKKYLLVLMFSLFVILSSANMASATIKLNGVSTDPAIIASGDEVDIVLNFQDVDFDPNTEKKDASLSVKLEGSNTITKNYVTIFEDSGEGSIGHLFSGENWRSVFRVKINENAPPGEYEFSANFKWIGADGNQIGGTETKYFKLTVKKEGINVLVSNLQTVPGEVRSGDEYVKLDIYLENVGEKDAKSVGVKLNLPEELSHSYSNANDIRIGRLNAGEQKSLTFYIDVVDGAPAQIYNLDLLIDYIDLDNNQYTKQEDVQLLVKEKPQIKVINYSGSGVIGGSGKLYVTLENIGSETAEAVDVRLVKQSSQPFEFDVRSNYVGQLEPGETGVAVFDIDVSRSAEEKEHDFSVFIRAKGDTDNGNDNIYTFSDRAKFVVSGEKPNYLLYAGLGILGLLVLVGIVRAFRRK